MRLAKIVLTGLIAGSLVTPAFAAGEAVRPKVKAVSTAAARQNLALAARVAPAREKVTAESTLIGLPLLALLGALVAVAAVVVVATDNGSSPS